MAIAWDNCSPHASPPTRTCTCFYRDLYAQALGLAPDTAVAALADVICLLPLLRALNVMTRTGPLGEEARDRIGRHVDRLEADAERHRLLYARMAERNIARA
ncbi:MULTISPECIES: hypothetical protein [unclassified Streptomyces]|uniref:hypothetical protein n=1 Tax=unclassified Streptomyces TaxID=2593676 RepID=UPI002E303F7F|nr:MULTISPECIES: hypothetical protein [unclassified Streptomyces]